jgi:hypothetical protein
MITYNVLNESKNNGVHKSISRNKGEKELNTVKKEQKRHTKESIYYDEDGSMETTKQITNAYLSGVVDQQLEDNFFERQDEH